MKSYHWHRNEKNTDETTFCVESNSNGGFTILVKIDIKRLSVYVFPRVIMNRYIASVCIEWGSVQSRNNLSLVNPFKWSTSHNNQSGFIELNGICTCIKQESVGLAVDLIDAEKAELLDSLWVPYNEILACA